MDLNLYIKMKIIQFSKENIGEKNLCSFEVGKGFLGQNSLPIIGKK